MHIKHIFYNPTIRIRSFSTSLIRNNLFNKVQLIPLKQLQQHAPTFYAHGQNIQPLYQPFEFYSELKSRILSAKKSIFIAALYIGHTEQELVRNCILNIIYIDCIYRLIQ